MNPDAELGLDERGQPACSHASVPGSVVVDEAQHLQSDLVRAARTARRRDQPLQPAAVERLHHAEAGGARHPEPCRRLGEGAHRDHLSDASLELLGQQPDDEAQGVADQHHSAPDPTYRAREPDRVAAQRIGRRAVARGLLGMRHYRFDVIQGAREPGRQTIRQQAEGCVALGAVPASDLRPARGLARVGAVACQRTSAVRVIRAALETCIAPRLGPNVSLAGVPCLIPKLHRPWLARGSSPRAGQLLSSPKERRDYGDNHRNAKR